MVLDGTGGKWSEGMEMIGGRDIPKDSGGGGGGPITPGVKDGIEGIEGIEGIGGGPIGAELIAVGGPRFSGGKVEPKGGGGIGAELTEHIEDEPRVGPMGAAGLGKGGRREW